MVEQFFSAIFEHAPSGSFFYGARIFKQIKKAYPKFYTDPGDLLADIKDHREADQPDFYFSPAFYSRKTKAIKSNVKGAGVAWVDIDGGDFPDFEQDPNFVIETSPGHFHCYWLLGGMKKPDEVEAINRTLAYQYNTDKSGWDATQLLRPPGSFNRKRDNFRANITRSNLDTLADFSSVDVGDYRPVDTASAGTSGGSTVESLLAELVFTKRVRELIFTATESKSGEGRSGLIFHTACELVKMKLKDAEILMLLEFQDLRLGKFTNHADRKGVLQGTIARAREKEKTSEPKEERLRPVWQEFSGNQELFTYTSDDKFLCEHILFEEGILIISGEPGSGKSRFILNLMDCLACGQNFLGKKVEQAIKSCYLSLDMTAPRIRTIRKQQRDGFASETDRALIDQNVLIKIAAGGIDLSKPQVQEETTAMLLKTGAKFIVVDVLGRALPDLKKDDIVGPFIDWMKGYINETSASFGLVTHTRKSQVGNKAANKLDDYYGSRYWSIIADTGIIIEPTGTESAILHINKDRSGGLGERIELKKEYKTSHYSLVTSETPSDNKMGVAGSSGIPV